jgi:hypothetical protein
MMATIKKLRNAFFFFTFDMYTLKSLRDETVLSD